MLSELPVPNFFTTALLEKLRRHPKRVVFPEADDPRVLVASAELVRHEAILPILLGNRAKLKGMAKDLGIDMTFIHCIDPTTSSDLPVFCERYIRTESIRGFKVVNAESVVTMPHQFAAMMVQYGQADAVVSGNLAHATIGYRALLQRIKPQPGVPAPFGAMVLVDDAREGDERVLILADCGIHVDPSPEQLAAIAVHSGILARHITGRRAKVAMLSHSTKGNAVSPSSLRVSAGTALAREKVDAFALEIDIEGEIQADVALSPAIAAQKTETSLLHGEADVLVFPSLDAADIAVRLLRHLAGYRTYGQIVLGLARPAAQLPRSATIEQIFGTALAVGVEAVKYHDIYPHGETDEVW